MPPFKTKKYSAATAATVIGHVKSGPQTVVKRQYGQRNQGGGYRVVK
jgi:hypothetical protein